jgi:hypothetical protein
MGKRAMHTIALISRKGGTFRRHLGRQIARAFTARPTPLDTVELAQWAYPGRPFNNWMRDVAVLGD